MAPAGTLASWSKAGFHGPHACDVASQAPETSRDRFAACLHGSAIDEGMMMIPYSL